MIYIKTRNRLMLIRLVLLWTNNNYKSKTIKKTSTYEDLLWKRMMGDLLKIDGVQMKYYIYFLRVLRKKI